MSVFAEFLKQRTSHGDLLLADLDLRTYCTVIAAAPRSICTIIDTSFIEDKGVQSSFARFCVVLSVY